MASPDRKTIELEAFAEHARLSVIPLFRALSRTRFDSVGSALLLRSIGGQAFVVTAGHVLAGVSPDPLLTWGTATTGAIRLPYGNAIASEPREARRLAGSIDLAAFLIDDAVVDKLAAVGATFISELSLDDNIDLDSSYAFVGYPRSMNKPDRGRSTTGRLIPMLPNTAMFVVARPAELTSYAAIGADPRVNFVAHYDHSSGRRHDDPHRPLPQLPGMSGGAVYCLGRSYHFRSRVDVRLVGIGTEHHVSARLLVAAKSLAVRTLIARLERRRRSR